MTSSKQSTIDFLRASDCGVHEEIPLVCCGEDADYDAEHQPIEQRNRTVNISTRTGEDTEIHLGSRFGGGDDGRIYGSRSQLAGRHECGYMVIFSFLRLKKCNLIFIIFLIGSRQNPQWNRGEYG